MAYILRRTLSPALGEWRVRKFHFNRTYYVLNARQEKRKEKYSHKHGVIIGTVDCRNFSMEEFQIFLSTNQLSTFARDSLIYVHDTLGLPWWATIMCTTAALKLLTSYLYVEQQYVIAHNEARSKEIEKCAAEIRKEAENNVKTSKMTRKAAVNFIIMEIKKKNKEYIIKHNCHPLKSSLSMLVQLPVWVSLSISLRNMAFGQYMEPLMAQQICEQLQVEGIGWIPNLILPDQCFILPLVFLATNLIIIETHHVYFGGNKPTTFRRRLSYFLRILAVFGFYISLQMPAGMTLYWVTSNSLQLAQTLIVMSPNVRRFVKIPKTSFERERPFGDLLRILRKDWKNRWTFSRN